MPRRDDLETIMVLGSGPIKIGQAAEFDFSGSQAVRALREDGYKVILVNSNPATIQNDPEMADIVYIELPEEGDVVGDMGEFAVVESVKSASPIFAPLAGTITAVNMELEDAPELMNSSPYGDGWIVKMTLDDASAVAGLMYAAAYKAEIGE